MKLGYLLLVALVGCTMEPVKPDVEVRTNVVSAPVVVTKPCFTESERPVIPVRANIDPETATTEQLAAVELKFENDMQVYTNAVDALFTQCRGDTK